MQTHAATYVDFICSNPALPESVKQWVREAVPAAFERLDATNATTGTIVHDFTFDSPDDGRRRDLAMVIHVSTVLGRMNIIDQHTDALAVDEFDFFMSPDGTGSAICDRMRSHRSLAEARDLATRFESSSIH